MFTIFVDRRKFLHLLFKISQMKKIFYLAILSLIAVACNSQSKSSDSDKKTLTVTIDPQRFFLEQIVGEDFNINVLVPSGTSPETYEPAPSVMLDMNKSDMYFKVGELGFEKAWSARLAENNPNVTIVDCSANIELLKNDDEHAHEGHSHGAMDPHVWSSPVAAKIFAKNMLDAVVSAYPESAETYQANFDKLMQRINATDSTIKASLVNSPTKAFIIYHPALGYFAEEYGLHQHSIEFEGKNPSPAQMKELVDLAREENINTILVQKGFDMKNAEVVASEINAEIFEIDPLTYDWDKELIRIAQILSRKSDE